MRATFELMEKDLQKVLQSCKISQEDIMGSCRVRRLCLVRSALANVWRKKYMRVSQMSIAVMLNRNRSTVSFYCGQHKDWYRFDPTYRNMYDKIKQLIGGGEDENTY